MAQQPRFTIFLTPGQALGAYAITGIFRTVGIVFAISGFLSFIIITISMLLIGIFPIPVFLLAILFFPGIGPVTLAIKKNKQRAAEIQHQQQQQYYAAQQQQAEFQQWQQQKQWTEYQQFLAWKQQQNLH